MKMSKGLTNNQILLNEIIKQEHQENQQFINEDEFFEFYAVQQVLKNYDLSDEEVENGLTGASADGGCDGIYQFANGDLINEDDDLAKYRKDIKLTLCIFQTKNTSSFKENSIMKWKTVCKNLLNLNTSCELYKDRYRSNVLSAFSFFKDTYIKLIRRVSKLNIEFKYVSKGIEVHPSVKAQADELCNEIKSLFPGPSVSVNVEFIGADILMELISSPVNQEFYLKVAESPITISSQQTFISLVNISDYFRFITDEKQEIVKHIFEPNVRDYQGNTSVNKEIQESLKNPSDEDFWWLNNGVTIIANEASLITGKEIRIIEPEVVNGLQTSTEIYKFFSEHKDRLAAEKRNILVRVIVPHSEESKDRIILATNSQTTIPKASLRATDVIHRQIEMYFKPRGLYYDRRKNYYKNQGKKASQIVSVAFLAQCLMSTLLQKPNYARARPSTLLTDDDTYIKLYFKNQNLKTFYTAAYVGKRVEKVLKRNSDYTRAQKADILFYVLYYSVARVIGQVKINNIQLADVDHEAFSDSFILSCAKDVFAHYVALGGNDKVAKGSVLINQVKIILRKNIKK